MLCFYNMADFIMRKIALFHFAPCTILPRSPLCAIDCFIVSSADNLANSLDSDEARHRRAWSRYCCLTPDGIPKRIFRKSWSWKKISRRQRRMQHYKEEIIKRSTFSFPYGSRLYTCRQCLRTTKAETSLRVRAVCSVPLLFTYWKVWYQNML